MEKQNSMDSNFNKEDFQNLIEKYLEGRTSLEEMKLLINYCQSFQQNNYLEELFPEDGYRERMLKNIFDRTNEEVIPREPKIIKIFKSNIFKFSAAAAILLFVFFNAVYQTNSPAKISGSENSVVVNDIKIGTDKATLTTEDGSVVVLEKGKSFKGRNATSNGEQLVYKGSSQKNEVAFNYLTIPRGGEFYLKLSDGTQVWLNSESKIKYPTAFVEGVTRKVELLYGEAYFTVSPSTEHSGAKFQVLKGSQQIEVLGTQFNVKAYKDENVIYTTLVEGKVSVETANRKEILKPNDQFALNVLTNKTSVAKVDTYTETAWKKGLFAFKSKNLKEIMQVLSRWYDVDVVFEDKSLETVEFKGVLNKNQKIEEILSLIKKTKFIKAYEIKNNQITIKN